MEFEHVSVHLRIDGFVKEDNIPVVCLPHQCFYPSNVFIPHNVFIPPV